MSAASVPTGPSDGPSRTLLSAAVAGLLGVGAPACGGGPGEADAGGPHVISMSSDPSMTFEKFSALCEGRGGYVETTAVCAGNNSCKGLSFVSFDSSLMEHSCKAMNACGPGLSCVELPADTGKTGEAIYQSACGPVCHSTGVDSTRFTLWVVPGTDHAQAQAAFLARSPLYHESLVAFGGRAVSPQGVALATMPSFHQRYARKEVERVVRYVLGMPVDVATMTVYGWDAGVP